MLFTEICSLSRVVSLPCSVFSRFSSFFPVDWTWHAKEFSCMTYYFSVLLNLFPSFLPTCVTFFFTCNSFLFFSQADASACWLFESKISVTFDDIFSHTVSYSREKHLPLYIDLYCFFSSFHKRRSRFVMYEEKGRVFQLQLLIYCSEKVAHSDDQQDRRTQ